MNKTNSEKSSRWAGVLSTPLQSSQGYQICDHYDFNAQGGNVGLKVSDSQHFRSGEDFNIKLLSSHHVGLDVYTDRQL